jgi:hypothetical protein
MTLDLRLKRADRVYRPGDVLTGFIVVNSPKEPLSHQGITLVAEGVVTLQSSAKSVGVFDAFLSSLKPVVLLSLQLPIAAPGKLPAGRTEIPFEFPLTALPGAALYETYHGVFVNIAYVIKVDMPRSLLAKNLSATTEFLVEVPVDQFDPPTVIPFTLTPESLDMKRGRAAVPRFRITGQLSSATCDIESPFTGTLTVDESDAVIRSIELQLVRVETCGSAEGYAKEATEIQNVQVADGDVCRKLSIPLHMIFPRLFTCPSLATRTFKLEFEVNLVVVLADGYVITENFPIKLYRRWSQK